MSKLLLLSLLLLAPAAIAQDGAVASLETDRSEYAYGETIELRYTITNEGDSPFTLNASSETCAVSFTFGSLTAPGEDGACTLAEVWYEFDPGASWTWVWQILPNEHAVPEADGAHTITASFEGETFPAATTLAAPEYLGGRVIFRLADGFTQEDVQDVLEALNAEIIEDWEPTLLLEIEGTTVADAIAAYASDPRFVYFEIFREIYPDSFYATDAEVTPKAGTPELTAAHPNPFATSTSFALTVPETGTARVEVFDLLGRRVAVLHDGPLAAGPEHRFTFHASALPSGLYVVRATGEGFTETRRVTLAR